MYIFIFSLSVLNKQVSENDGTNTNLESWILNLECPFSFYTLHTWPSTNGRTNNPIEDTPVNIEGQDSRFYFRGGRSEQEHNITNSEAPQTQNHDCPLLPKEFLLFRKLLETLVAEFGLSCVLVNPGLGDFLRAGREARHLCLGVGESARYCLLSLLRGRKATPNSQLSTLGLGVIVWSRVCEREGSTSEHIAVYLSPFRHEVEVSELSCT